MSEEYKPATIAHLQKESWRIAEESGFHEGDDPGDTRSRAKILALIHSEISEALEADRNNEPIGSYAEELADTVIRILDHAETEGIDLQRVIHDKMRENEKREYKHGKEY